MSLVLLLCSPYEKMTNRVPPDHPACFVCSDGRCNCLLDQFHYVLSGLPYCEGHARELEDRQPVDTDAYYSLNASDRSVSASNSSQRIRDMSQDIPVSGSISALRKGTTGPNYRGLTRKGSEDRVPTSHHVQRPLDNTRRAEKRRTVIQNVGKL